MIFPIEVYYDIEWLDQLLSWFSAPFMLFLIALIFAALYALLPVGEKSYSGRFQRMLPACFLFFNLLLSIGLSRAAYLKMVKGEELSGPKVRMQSFDSIPEASPTQCQRIKTGKFFNERVEIDRSLELERIINRKTGEVTEFAIEWKNACEYWLYSVDDTIRRADDAIKTKISRASVDQYEAYTSFGPQNRQSIFSRKN